MYNQTQAQVDAEKTLVKQGFRFMNWIVDRDSELECDPSQTPNGTMLFCKGPRNGSKEYCEIAPDGSIN